VDDFANGDILGGILNTIDAAGTLFSMMQACFAAGTPLLTPGGHKLIEEFRAGDLVLSRDENNPEGPVVAKVVEEVFVHFGRIFHLHVGGQVIRTTGEHPFWVRGRGWVAARELLAGDLLGGHDGGWVAVDEVFDTGVTETVYNLRIADCHTYFVGAEYWGFSVWAHNACYKVALEGNRLVRIGRNLAVEIAARMVKRGEDIYASSRSLARRIAGRNAIGPEIDRVIPPGQRRFFHFHPANRGGGHVFFGGGIP
jgi:hypothetical protein